MNNTFILYTFYYNLKIIALFISNNWLLCSFMACGSGYRNKILDT